MSEVVLRLELLFFFFCSGCVHGTLNFFFFSSFKDEACHVLPGLLLSKQRVFFMSQLSKPRSHPHLLSSTRPTSCSCNIFLSFSQRFLCFFLIFYQRFLWVFFFSYFITNCFRQIAFNIWSFSSSIQATILYLF